MPHEHTHKSTSKAGTFPHAKRVDCNDFLPCTTDVVRFLVVNGANIQAKDEDGMPLGNVLYGSNGRVVTSELAVSRAAE